MNLAAQTPIAIGNTTGFIISRGLNLPTDLSFLPLIRGIFPIFNKLWTLCTFLRHSTFVFNDL